MDPAERQYPILLHGGSSTPPPDLLTYLLITFFVIFTAIIHVTNLSDPAPSVWQNKTQEVKI